VAKQMNHQYGLPMSSATAFEITSRVSKDLKEDYQSIIRRIRTASIINSDETVFKVDGGKFWLWTFVS
jgi:transposase-like protein